LLLQYQILCLLGGGVFFIIEQIFKLLRRFFVRLFQEMAVNARRRWFGVAQPLCDRLNVHILGN